MRKICITVLCILAVLSVGMTSVFALEFSLTPEKTDLGDGLVFWMTLPEDESLSHPASGLYKNGELLYTVDVDGEWWWASLYFSDDAKSFLFVPMIGGEWSAVRFYSQGVLVHEYGVLSLLEGGEDSLIPPYEIHTYYRWDLHRDHCRASNILRITTAENIVVSFDLSTGAIISTEPAEGEPAQSDYNSTGAIISTEPAEGESAQSDYNSTDAIISTESAEDEPNHSNYNMILIIGLGIAACVMIVALLIKRSK